MDSANAETFYFAACFFFLTYQPPVLSHDGSPFFSLASTGFSFLFPVVENWTAW